MNLIRRWLVGIGISSWGSSATGHTHAVEDDGTIDCEECARAHSLTMIEPEPETASAPSEVAPAVKATPVAPVAAASPSEPVAAPASEPAKKSS